MHYKINDTLIKSENAAKPTFTPSKDMLFLLKKYIKKSDHVLDYGCGKLRYTIPISKMAKIVHGVDSNEQIYRPIKLRGKTISIYNLAKKYKNIVLHAISKKEWQKFKYDKILLSHVLSAVPHEKDRFKIACALHGVMHAESILIACTNHRMSYFKKWDISPRVEKYNDGYFIKEPIPSYFGIINKVKLAGYFEQSGFEILQLFIKEDNTYCICKKKLTIKYRK